MKIKIVSGNAGERSISAQIPFSGMNSQSYADQLAPDVAPYQCFREGPAGNTAKKKNKNSTFKAGMCMKTKETQTICPKKVGHFCLSFGHFRLTDMSFAEIRGELSMKQASRGDGHARHLRIGPRHARLCFGSAPLAGWDVQAAPCQGDTGGCVLYKFSTCRCHAVTPSGSG